MTLPEFLEVGEDQEIRLAGHRIGILHIVHYFTQGFTPEMIAGQYPTLPLHLIYKVIGFYLDNQADVDAYVAKCNADMLEQRADNRRRLNVDLLRQRLKGRAASAVPQTQSA